MGPLQSLTVTKLVHLHLQHLHNSVWDYTAFSTFVEEQTGIG